MAMPRPRPRTVTVRIDDTGTDTVPAAVNRAAAPPMSLDEYQRLTLEELADDVIVDGVAYSRTEWERAEYGVQRTTTADDEPPAAQRTQTPWNGTDAPY